MKIVLVNYGAGNIKSLQFALERLGVQGVLCFNSTAKTTRSGDMSGNATHVFSNGRRKHGRPRNL